MSQLKVNALVSYSGTTITLGTTGDTINVASGVTFNTASATVNLPTTIKVSTIQNTNSTNLITQTNVTTITFGATSQTISVPSVASFASTIGVGGATPAASGAGITFPASASLSSDGNTLDDFEEGTWTPTYVAATTNFSSVTYEQQVGKYTKIGRMIFLTVTISTTAITKGSAAGDIFIAGLPFAPDQQSSNATALNATVNWAGDIPIGWTLFSGNNNLYLYYKSGTSSLNINPDDMGTGGSANNFAATMIYTTTS